MRRQWWAIGSLLLMTMLSCRQHRAIMTSGVSEEVQNQAIVVQAKNEKPLFSEKTSIALQTNLYDQLISERLPGLVLYIASSKGKWMGAAGRADTETKKTLKPTDRFRIASLTKIFVSVVCLQLTEEGRLDLDQPIAQWLPQTVSDRIPNVKLITPRHLLNHTSGLPDPYTESFQQAVSADPTHRWTTAEVLEYMYDQKPVAPRGVFSYSNSNYLLLELIIEQITGEPLATILHDRIRQPLELRDTYMELQESVAGGFVAGYQDWNQDGTLENIKKPFINDGLGLGDGGLISSAPDLVRFFQALVSGDRLLGAGSLAKMLQPAPDGSGGGYGLGLSYRVTDWGEAWGHTGKALGFCSAIVYLPAHDLTIVAWTNENSEENDRNDVPAKLIEESLGIILGK